MIFLRQFVEIMRNIG